MDLQLYFRVLWRFRTLVAAGMVLALSLASLSIVRVSSDGASYRGKEVWASESRLMVTQRGFPIGRAVTEEIDALAEAKRLGIPFAHPDRFASLAVLYAQLVTGDPVRAIMLQDGPIRGTVDAGAVVTQQNAVLPLIDIVALSDTPRNAVALGERATAAIRTYLGRQQEANDVPPENRVVVQVLARPKRAELIEGRSMTLPTVIFVTTLIAAVGLAFALENVRPRVRPVADEAVGAPPASRRTA